MTTPPTQPSGAPDLDDGKPDPISYQRADYILNHYNKDSYKDKLCLARWLENLLIEYAAQLQAQMLSDHADSLNKCAIASGEKIRQLQSEIESQSKQIESLQAQLAQHPDTKRLDWVFEYCDITPNKDWENNYATYYNDRSAIDEVMIKARKI